MSGGDGGGNWQLAMERRCKITKIRGERGECGGWGGGVQFPGCYGWLVASHTRHLHDAMHVYQAHTNVPWCSHMCMSVEFYLLPRLSRAACGQSSLVGESRPLSILQNLIDDYLRYLQSAYTTAPFNLR